jgi:hypothetical protein
MSEDMERALHLRRVLAHLEKQKAEAKDDAGRLDASKAIAKTAQQIIMHQGGRSK